jgi:hypothetical protein
MYFKIRLSKAAPPTAENKKAICPQRFCLASQSPSNPVPAEIMNAFPK